MQYDPFQDCRESYKLNKHIACVGKVEVIETNKLTTLLNKIISLIEVKIMTEN